MHGGICLPVSPVSGLSFPVDVLVQKSSQISLCMDYGRSTCELHGDYIQIACGLHHRPLTDTVKPV